MPVSRQFANEPAARLQAQRAPKRQEHYQETGMSTKQLMAMGLAACLLAGCGGDDGTSDPVMPVAPAAITCPTSAAALVKSTLRVGTVDREYYDSAPADYAARREHDARGIVVVVNFHDAG